MNLTPLSSIGRLRAPMPQLTGPAPKIRFGTTPPPQTEEPKGWLKRWKLKLGLLLAGGLTAYTGAGYTTTAIKIHGDASRFQSSPNVRIHYMVPKGFGHWVGREVTEFEEANVDFSLPWVKSAVAKRFAEVLQKRPDLMKAIMEFPNGMDIRLYKADNLERHGDMETLGMVQWNHERQALQMTLSTGGINLSDRSYEDGIDVKAHELAHVLDSIEIQNGKTIIVGADGFLPGWNDGDKMRWHQAMLVEMAKMEVGRSPMNQYGLTDEHEFLAVAVETYFERGSELQDSNPVLYDMLEKFFKIHTADSLPVAIGRNILSGNLGMEYVNNRDSMPFNILIAGFGILTIVGGRMLVLKARKKKDANVPPEMTALGHEMKALEKKLKQS